MSTEPRCDGCFMKPALCMCALLPRIATKTRVSVVMHNMEHVKSTNTGRLVHRCLENCELFLFGNNLPALPETMWRGTPAVLFPVAGARDVVDVKPDCLIVLDANWRQAARLRKRFAVHNIEFVKAPPGPSIYKLRKNSKEGMSTLEAVARSLQVLDGGDVGDELLRVLRIFQDRTLWLRGALDKNAVEGGIPDGVRRHAP